MWRKYRELNNQVTGSFVTTILPNTNGSLTSELLFGLSAVVCWFPTLIFTRPIYIKLFLFLRMKKNLKGKRTGDCKNSFLKTIGQYQSWWIPKVFKTVGIRTWQAHNILIEGKILQKKNQANKWIFYNKNLYILGGGAYSYKKSGTYRVMILTPTVKSKLQV